MGSFGTFLLSILVSVSVAHGAQTERWEFGVVDTPGSVVIAHDEGDIGTFERTKKINLAVPKCYTITYVKVKISNLISNPKVDFDPQTSIVTISYHFWQHSRSTYDIVARAVWKQGCIITSMMQERNYF
ncbi:hypothetical protein PYW08_015582 [Mythimna loreyi]|uniref:Uncharacterized protein n=1 Tax=Mythimna loreyi TaxID=667449 RepID=A0ACC2QY14_9NEOP|nr:hypothetical protein PYW08_015582 [Mythimna loreyi]